MIFAADAPTVSDGFVAVGAVVTDHKAATSMKVVDFRRGVPIVLSIAVPKEGIIIFYTPQASSSLKLFLSRSPSNLQGRQAFCLLSILTMLIPPVDF